MQQYVHCMAWVLIVLVLAATLPVVREKVGREEKRKEKKKPYCRLNFTGTQ